MQTQPNVIHTNAILCGLLFVNYDLVNIEVPYDVFHLFRSRRIVKKKELDEVLWKSFMTANWLLTLVIPRLNWRNREDRIIII